MQIEKGQASGTYDVQVAGVPLRLRSSHDEQTVRELIDLVDSRVKEAMAANSNTSFQKALLLTSLHIAEELLFLKRALIDRLEGLEGKTKAVLNELDSSALSKLTLDQ